jgi:hypothetical protein
MDPRLAVHAGPPARQKVSAWLATLAALALASPAAAAPKGARAKKDFDRGVAAYQKQNYAAASEALAASFKAEPDAETLFAWAQSERQLEHCEKSIELFTKLLDFNLPVENKKVIQGKIDECKALVPAKPAAPAEKPAAPAEKPAAPAEKPAAPAEKQPAPTGPSEAAKPPPAESPGSGPERSPWWKDPIGDGLVVAGVVGLGVGGYFLMSAKSASDDLSGTPPPPSEAKFQELKDKADSRGKIGVIATAAGGVLVVGGIVRYMTRGGGGNQERTALTGWLSPDGGGVAAVGRF